MNSEPKAFASLSSGLLARKGGARPAMRPQGFGQAGAGLEDLGWNDMGFEPPKPAPAPRDDEHDAFGEEIAEHPALNGHAGLTPVHSPVHTQQAEIAGRLVANSDEDEAEAIEETAELHEAEVPLEPEAEPQPVLAAVPAPVTPIRRVRKPRAAPGSKAKAAFTLRLDPDRHLKLRLACAVSGDSAQQLVTKALDEALARLPELEGMAAKAARRG